ncbi:MAG: Glutamate-1-semialdehyde aminotransferase (EC [uncultured Campylobacterales bacterium]|uniref:Glutamate-1-semialdehyde 2,1-aminomutase n=1 Tax=uncultured Campylobacterales bacterium TaxID=352960 RepID=A0A6S6T175_9BACT|nr:MAG: Glutamate-1-semialdehyde aminotransferase (EC [uncultured Campylobacterales bacterium]
MNTQKSSQEFKQAKQVIPGGVNSPVRAFKSVGTTPIFIASANGAYIQDVDGNKYIDYVQSWGPLIFGHSDELSIQAASSALNNGLSFGAPTTIETNLASQIVSLFDNIDKIRFVNSGTEAVMSAIRLARGYTNKNNIIKFEGCYHGHSDCLLVEAGSGAVTFGNPSSSGVPKSFTDHTMLAHYNDIASVEKCFENSDDIACIIIEPIAGNMGFIPADKEFLSGLKKLCEKNGALLIFDEVMSGFRADLRGATGVYGIEPDIVTFGKVIGGGMPVGAFASTNEIMAVLSPDGSVYQAGTLSGNPVAMSVGESVISRLIQNPDIYKDLEVKAKRLTTGLKEQASKYNVPFQSNAIGSMFGFFFNKNQVKNFEDAKNSDTKLFAKFHKHMLDNGIYLACSAYESGFISTAITNEMIDKTIMIASDFFKSI